MTANWLLDEGITVIVPSAVGSAGGGTAPAVPLRDVQLRDLTASILIEALHHVRQARAYGTYRTAHECVTAIVAWAVKQRWAPPGWLDTRDVKRLADPRSGARRARQGRHIAPDPQDDIVPVDEVLRFRGSAEQLGGRGGALLFDLLAFAGPPIGAALALPVSRWWRDEDRSGWFDIEERADRTSKRQSPPKHRKHREMWVPAWLTDDLDAIGPSTDGWWFPAPDGATWPVDRWRVRRFDRWAEVVDWPVRADYCHHSTG